MVRADVSSVSVAVDGVAVLHAIIPAIELLGDPDQMMEFVDVINDELDNLDLPYVLSLSKKLCFPPLWEIDLINLGNDK